MIHVAIADVPCVDHGDTHGVSTVGASAAPRTPETASFDTREQQHRVVWTVDQRRRHIVSVRGEFDDDLSSPVADLIEGIALTRPASMTLDAGELSLFGSNGLRAIERSAAALHRVGCSLTIRNASVHMRRVLEDLRGPAQPRLDSTETERNLARNGDRRG